MANLRRTFQAFGLLKVFGLLGVSSALVSCGLIPTACPAIGFVYVGPYPVEVRGVPSDSVTVLGCLAQGCTPRGLEFSDGVWNLQPRNPFPDTAPSSLVPSDNPVPRSPSPSAEPLDPTTPDSMFIQVIRSVDQKVLFAERRTIPYSSAAEDSAPARNSCPDVPRPPQPVVVELG